MASATPTRLMTVEEFYQEPDRPGVRLELHHGEIVEVAPVKLRHFKIQRRLRNLLQERLGDKGEIDHEFAFRPTSQYEYRVADVAFITSARYELADDDDNIRGAPDLVVEVLSPSNSAIEMNRKEALCLQNGALEFWVIDPDVQQVRVSSNAGTYRIFGKGEWIPLTAFGGEPVPVDRIFS